MSFTRRFALSGAGVVAGLVGVYEGWNLLMPSATLRYKLTVEVEVGGEVRTGSSVIETVYTSYRRLPVWIGNPVGVRTKGQATVVDLGNRGLIFILISNLPYPDDYRYRSNLDPEEMALVALGVTRGGTGVLTEGQIWSLPRVSKSVDLPRELYPAMVKFGDPRVPTSVQYVYPENLERSFGPGVKLLRVQMATTREPITTGIEKVLPWLPGATVSTFGDRRNGRRSGLPHPFIGANHFAVGMKWKRRDGTSPAGRN